MEITRVPEGRRTRPISLSAAGTYASKRMRLFNSMVDVVDTIRQLVLSRPGRRREFRDSIDWEAFGVSPTPWISGADGQLDGLSVGGAPVGFRPSLLAREQRLGIGQALGRK